MDADIDRYVISPISGFVFIHLADGTILECAGPVFIRRQE